MARWLWAMVLLVHAAGVEARPHLTRVQGHYLSGQPIAVRGKYFQGEVRFDSLPDLRDALQLRTRVQLTNRSNSAGFFSLYLILQDSSGAILGAEGRQETAFARQPGWKFDHEIDLAMPRQEQARAGYYQILLIEDTTRLDR